MKKQGRRTAPPRQAAPQAQVAFFDAYDLIAGSGLFDTQFYVQAGPPPAGSESDPIVHYLETGAREGRAPHRDFDPDDYLAQCARRGIQTDNPLLHYLLEGKRLGLKPKAVPSQGGASQRRIFDQVLRSGLFDLRFYKLAHRRAFKSESEGLRHFLAQGCDSGHRPNLYFDPAWYLKTNPELKAARVQPLVHYLLHGDSEGRRPSLIFDSAWCRKTYSVPAEQNALAHYLRHRGAFLYNPVPEFDAAWYGDRNPDVRATGQDPFEHFVLAGFREGRNPSTRFNLRQYARRHLDGSSEGNPFLHYLEHKSRPGTDALPAPDTLSRTSTIERYTRPGPEFEEFRPLTDAAPRRAKLLAYYLPQFHSFPENDEWWGKGFTEWTNIVRGVSHFEGHYQPRIPRDLGFYSLETPETLRRQAQMAKQAGIHGFVFYYYWFNGKRLMQTPIENFLADTDVDMPFALIRRSPGHDRRYAIDASRVERELGWTPAQSFESGILKTVRWYLDNLVWAEKVTGCAYRQWLRQQYGADAMEAAVPEPASPELEPSFAPG